jgi:hypothetical protein
MLHSTSLTRQLIATVPILAWGLIPGDRAPGAPAQIREALRRDLPSQADDERMERGDYEQPLDAGRSLDAVTFIFCY